MKLIYTTLFMLAFTIAVLSLRPTIVKASNEDRFRPEMATKIIPPCLQMHYSIEKFAAKYNIPKKYAYGIAEQETEYKGPFQWHYRQHCISPVGALGAMQIMPGTARGYWPHRKVTREMLLDDIDFNVETSMKILRDLYNTYGDWQLAFGAYNTGRPMVNGYARRVYNHK